MKFFSARISLLVFFLAGCISASPVPATDSDTEAIAITSAATRTLTVFAAASLTNAFTEIGEGFQAENPDVTITFSFAGSQSLRTQIEEGAPVDIFAPANNTEMNALVNTGLVTKEMPKTFLTNKLVVVLPADNPAGINELEDIANAGVKIIFAAEEVPVGKYTREALEKMNHQYGNDFGQKVLANVVSNEDNVRQVLTKVQLGEADAGIVYTSDAIAAPELQTIDIPLELNIVATYSIAPLTESDEFDLAQAFIAYVLSNNGQAILQKWGFAPP